MDFRWAEDLVSLKTCFFFLFFFLNGRLFFLVHTDSLPVESFRKLTSPNRCRTPSLCKLLPTGLPRNLFTHKQLNQHRQRPKLSILKKYAQYNLADITTSKRHFFFDALMSRKGRVCKKSDVEAMSAMFERCRCNVTFMMSERRFNVVAPSLL